MPRYDDDDLLAALALPGGIPRGRGGFGGNGNNRGGSGGDRGQGAGRGRGRGRGGPGFGDQENGRGGRGGQGGGRGGRGGGQNLNLNYDANAPHATQNANQQGPSSSKKKKKKGKGPATNGAGGSLDEDVITVDFNDLDSVFGLPPSTSTAHLVPAAETPTQPQARGGFRGRGWVDRGGFRGGRGSGWNVPQPFNTRGGRGGTQNRGRGSGRGGYNQIDVDIQSIGYDYNAMRGGHPKGGGRGGRTNGTDEDWALRRLGVDFGEGNPYLRKIKFVKSSVVLFHDQEEIFKPEVAEIDAQDPNSSMPTADQVNAVFDHEDESSDSESDEDGAAGDISFATQPPEDEEDEGEEVNDLAEAAATLAVDSSQDVILIGSSQLQPPQSVKTTASLTTIVTKTTPMTFVPPEDLIDFLSPPLQPSIPASPDITIPTTAISLLDSIMSPPMQETSSAERVVTEAHDQLVAEVLKAAPLSPKASKRRGAHAVVHPNKRSKKGKKTKEQVRLEKRPIMKNSDVEWTTDSDQEPGPVRPEESDEDPEHGEMDLDPDLDQAGYAAFVVDLVNGGGGKAETEEAEEMEVVEDDGDEDWEDEPSSEEGEVKKASRRVDKGKQRAFEVEDVPDMLDEDDEDEDEDDEFDYDDLDETDERIEEFFAANEEILMGGGKGGKGKRAQQKLLFRMLSEPMTMDDPMLDTGKMVKRKKGHPPDWVPPELEAQWMQDRKKKAANKQRRAEERAKQLAEVAATGRKNKKKAKIHFDDSDDSSDMLDVNSIAAQIIEFVEDDQENKLKMPLMSKADRKKVHNIAQAYNLKSASIGKGRDRFTTLSKTPKTGVNINYGRLNAALREWGAHKAVKSMKEGGPKKARHREGDIVGQHAAEIDESNVGYRLLQTMGWSAGNKIGVTGGLEAPLKAVFKVTKLGLGAAK